MVKPFPLILNSHSDIQPGKNFQFQTHTLRRGQSDFTHTVHSSKRQPIYKRGEANIRFSKCSHGVQGGFFSSWISALFFWNSHLICTHLSECNLQPVWNCFSYSISTLSLFVLRAAPGEVSGPIMRNTCWLTQIANTARWGSDCSWSIHVTSFSNHCPCADHCERNPLLWRHAGKDSGLKRYPFVSSIRAGLSDD